TDQLAAQMLADDPYATFVNLGSVFLQADGTISSSVMSDYLHPTELGYLELTSVLLPDIEQSLFGNSVTQAPSSLPFGSLSISGGFQTPPPSTPIPMSPS
ncbi:MAG: hypothetical protein ACRELF_29895, partial [Gemmataceae bacterium]